MRFKVHDTKAAFVESMIADILRVRAAAAASGARASGAMSVDPAARSSGGVSVD